MKSLAARDINISHISAVHGGDINQAVSIESSQNKKYFLKYNLSESGSAILNSELQGILLLREKGQPSSICIHHDLDINTPYLLLDWITDAPRNTLDIAKTLSHLHRIRGDNYGLEYQSHIGSLDKHKGWRSSFADFYTSLRILPLIKMAKDEGYSLNVNLERFEDLISSAFPIEPPSLIHGDLWSGNLMDSPEGPIFIDPSVEYAHRELDLAMMRLFGGFSAEIFEYYDEFYPLKKGWKDRADLLQLYYLLVHLVLFGGSYYSSVKGIFNKYLR